MKFETRSQLEPGVWLICTVGNKGKEHISAEYVETTRLIDGVVMCVKVSEKIECELPVEYREAVMPQDFKKPVLILDEMGQRGNELKPGYMVVGKHGEFTLVGGDDKRVVAVKKVLFDANPELHDNDQSRKVGDGDPENSSEGKSAVCANGLQ